MKKINFLKWALLFMAFFIITVLMSISIMASGDKDKKTEIEEGNFKDVKGWNMLKINMKADEARQALKKASVTFEEKTFYKEGKIYFKLKNGKWDGTVYFNEENNISQILFQSEIFKNKTEALAVLEEFKKKYGPPEEVKTVVSDENRDDITCKWKNDTVTLVLTLAYYNNEKHWIIWENYSPAKPL
jgi:hypothetical protein